MDSIEEVIGEAWQHFEDQYVAGVTDDDGWGTRSLWRSAERALEPADLATLSWLADEAAHWFKQQGLVEQAYLLEPMRLSAAFDSEEHRDTLRIMWRTRLATAVEVMVMLVSRPKIFAQYPLLTRTPSQLLDWNTGAYQW